MLKERDGMHDLCDEWNRRAQKYASEAMRNNGGYDPVGAHAAGMFRVIEENHFDTIGGRIKLALAMGISIPVYAEVLHTLVESLDKGKITFIPWDPVVYAGIGAMGILAGVFHPSVRVTYNGEERTINQMRERFRP